MNLLVPSMNILFFFSQVIIIRGVICEVRCRFLWIYVPTPYSAVFLLHAPTPVPIKIGFGMVWFT